MPRLQYLDFVVRLGLLPCGSLCIRVLRSPAGEGEISQPLPSWLGDAAEAWAASSLGAGRDVGEEPGREVVRRSFVASRSGDEIGARLHEMLFAGKIGRLWDQSLGSIGDRRDAGLRLRLQIDLDTAAGLASLPWELIFREDTGSYLCLNRQTPLLRHLEVAQPVQPTPSPGVLNILAVAASPRELASLDLTTEIAALAGRRGGKRRCRVSLLAQPTVEKLRQTLIEQGTQVLHFMGHGDFDSERQEGLLFFEDGEGGAVAWTGADLAAKLAGVPSLRLVVLNACQTATTGTAGGPFGGVAAALVRGGLPAVIAMQRPISDRAAIAFSKAFYFHLAAGAGLVGALTEGRQAIHTANPTGTEWAVPVLFGRAASFGFSADEGLPAFCHGIFAAVLLVLLGLNLLPPPKRAEVLIEASTSVAGFELSRPERVFDRVVVGELGASRLSRLELPPGMAPARSATQAAPAAVSAVSPPRLDLLLRAEEQPGSSITLQSGPLPAQTWVELRREEDGQFRLSLETPASASTGSFEALVRGSYRTVLRHEGRPAQRFAAEAATPQVLRFAPAGRRLDLDLAFRSFGESPQAPISISRLELFDVEERDVGAASGEGTVLAARFDLSGRLAVAGLEHDLPAGSQLHLSDPVGVVQHLAPTEKGIDLVFAGSVAGLRLGPLGDARDLMPKRTPALRFAIRFAAAVAVFIALVELAVLLRPRYRICRWKIRSWLGQNVIAGGIP